MWVSDPFGLGKHLLALLEMSCDLCPFISHDETTPFTFSLRSPRVRIVSFEIEKSYNL